MTAFKISAELPCSGVFIAILSAASLLNLLLLFIPFTYLRLPEITGTHPFILAFLICSFI